MKQPNLAVTLWLTALLLTTSHGWQYEGYLVREPDCGCVETTPTRACLASLELFRSGSRRDLCLQDPTGKCAPTTWSHRCAEYGEVATTRCSVVSFYGFSEKRRLPGPESLVVCELKKETVIQPAGFSYATPQIPQIRELFQERLADKCRRACPTCNCLPFDLKSPDRTPMFVDGLPSLELQAADHHFAAKSGPGVDLYIRSMRLVRHTFHRDISATPIFSFGASFLDGGIRAQSGKPIYVDWINRLPNNHILPVDESLVHHRSKLPEVQTVVHAHGAHSKPEFDGWPLDCRTNVPGNNSDVYRYGNDQIGTVTIFHDHCFGTNRLNNQAGLKAPFVIEDDRMERVLPQGEYHVTLAIKDFDFYSNGYLFYPDQGDARFRPSVIPEYFGGFLTVNGKAWPSLKVKRAVYRFSVINACNSRFLGLQLVRTTGGGPAPNITVVGSDHGLLEKPFETKQLVLGPLERSTILVDFGSETAGAHIELRNAALDMPFSTFEDSIIDCEISPACKRPTGVMMRFEVQSAVSNVYKIPNSLPSTPGYPVTDPTARTRVMTLRETTDEFGRLELLINDRNWSPEAFDDLKPKFGTVEVWCFKNLTPDSHPMHIHMIVFEVIKRISLKTGEEFGPEEAEKGFKDVARAYPGFTTCVGTSRFDILGKYQVHCHILEHEDWEMMQTFEVV